MFRYLAIIPIFVLVNVLLMMLILTFVYAFLCDLLHKFFGIDVNSGYDFYIYTPIDYVSGVLNILCRYISGK